MISVITAAKHIVADVKPLGSEPCPLRAALGLVLAQDAVAPYTMPAWNNSAMDGYAVRAEDVKAATAELPVTLTVVETVAAGAFPQKALGAGQAVRIMTGAPTPEGADTVIRVEDTDGGRTSVKIQNARDVGKNVRPQGEDFARGDLVVPKGTPIGPAQVGVLATLGMDHVEVIRRPIVAILGSGNELVDFDQFDLVLAGRKVMSSNTHSIAAMVHANGGIARPVGTAADTLESLTAGIQRAMGADLIVTTAGASVGEHDYTRAVLEKLGAHMHFWRVRMRPGAPLGYGTLKGTPWLALPGNPVSAMVTFEIFGRPLMRRLLGHRALFRRPLPVVVDEPVTTHAKLTHFLRAVVTPQNDGQLHARLTGPQSSGVLTSLSRANALLIVPEDKQQAAAGEVLNAYLLTEETHLSEDVAL